MPVRSQRAPWAGAASRIHRPHGDLPGRTGRGGHLLAWQVWPALEVIIREPPAEVRKTYRPELGVALIDLGRP
jgi:predicted DNA-binding protein with PD1-like motif